MRKSHPNNKLNNLSGDKWLFLTQSVMKTSYPKSHGFSLRQEHGANKPPQLMRDLISFFTKERSTVLDPFAGVGGTLLGASLCNRKALGIEISSRWISLYKKVCKRERINPHDIERGDCLKVMDKLINSKRKFSLILTDPPYNINLKRTMCRGRYRNRNRHTDFNTFSADHRDFSNCETYADYVAKMDMFIQKSFKLLFKNKFLVIITKNAYQDGKYIHVSRDIATLAESSGFTFKGEIIWYQNGVRLRPYGYPFTYVPNIIHHNILILRKEVLNGSSS